MFIFVSNASGTDTINVGVYDSGDTLIMSGSVTPSVAGLVKIPMNTPTNIVAHETYWLSYKGVDASSNVLKKAMWSDSRIGTSQFYGSTGLPTTRGGSATTTFPWLGFGSEDK